MRKVQNYIENGHSRQSNTNTADTSVFTLFHKAFCFLSSGSYWRHLTRNQNKSVTSFHRTDESNWLPCVIARKPGWNRWLKFWGSYTYVHKFCHPWHISPWPGSILTWTEDWLCDRSFSLRYAVRLDTLHQGFLIKLFLFWSCPGNKSSC